jgi:hypothetical protein
MCPKRVHQLWRSAATTEDGVGEVAHRFYRRMYECYTLSPASYRDGLCQVKGMTATLIDLGGDRVGERLRGGLGAG